jgi:hypothetical protein
LVWMKSKISSTLLGMIPDSIRAMLEHYHIIRAMLEHYHIV